jgi:hypothetical protein
MKNDLLRSKLYLIRYAVDTWISDCRCYGPMVEEMKKFQQELEDESNED